MVLYPSEAHLLFETSWEVCNKVGGIYTVLSTKAKTLQTLHKDKVIFIGPDIWTDENPSPFFIEQPSLLKKWHSKLSLPYGIKVRVGRWDIPGKPIVVLVKFDGLYQVKNDFYALMWQHFGVDSLHAYGDYDEACAFSLAAAMVIESLALHLGIESGAPMIAHFDEWTTGMGLLYTKLHLPAMATVFTTHATSIGRSICGNGKPLYGYLSGYNGDQMAGELNMQSKHSLEKAAAHAADSFTTVSEITAIECEQLLEIKPAVVTPNGFEAGFVPGVKKYAEARSLARKTMLNVAQSLTGQKFNDDKTLIVATSGRCEYRNKGIDMFIDSVAALAGRHCSHRILAFVMVPAWVDQPRADLANAMRRAGKKAALPAPFITHSLHNFDQDPIVTHISRANVGSESQPVIIYVPCYLNGTDGIFNLPYYQLIPGMDITVFPSYYEPWGYTPLESVAFGVPTVTTCLSGFGRWILSTGSNDFSASGVEVVDRSDFNYSQAVGAIAASLAHIDLSSPAERKKYAAAATHTAHLAAWQYFIKYYVDAYNTALEKAAARVHNS